MLKNQNQGFIRLETDIFRGKLLFHINDVILQKQRIVLVQEEKEVAAIIPADEFERLEWMRYHIKYGQFQIDEEYNDEDEYGIPCINIKELEGNFECILDRVVYSDENFGLTFPANAFEYDVENFVAVAILMNIHKFWIPDYWLIK